MFFWDGYFSFNNNSRKYPLVHRAPRYTLHTILTPNQRSPKGFFFGNITSISQCLSRPSSESHQLNRRRIHPTLHHTPSLTAATPDARSAKSILSPEYSQMFWSNLQCRQWLKAVLITLHHVPAPEAGEPVKPWVGIGAEMYLSAPSVWTKLLKERGVSVYRMLLVVRCQDGAVPEHMIVLHGNLDESKNRVS